MRPVVRLIVPRRGDGGHRDRLWSFCLRHWQRAGLGWQITTGDHDAGVFNRSAAINAGAAGRWDVAVVLDGDSVCDPAQLEAAVERALDGRLALAYSHRLLVGQAGTRRILDGYSGPWDSFIAGARNPTDPYRYVSGAVAVPRALWDAVGGFDPRFSGWGGEDDAFFAACTVLSGHDARQDPIPGDLWHLWHEHSPHEGVGPHYRMARALWRRYEAATDVAAMRRLLDEPREDRSTVLVCLTTGTRPDLLDSTLASAAEKLRGPIHRRLLLVDADRTRLRPAGWDVEAMGLSRGYAVAMGRAVERAIGSGQPWVFWLEDDFTFNRRVDVGAMQRTMDEYPDLAQLVLVRQPWYEPEVLAGGLLRDPRYPFDQRDGHVVHRNYWSMNPMLTRREVLARYEWPAMPGSESRFGRRIFSDPTVQVAFAGKIDQAPAVTHQGAVPAGTKY